MVHGGRDLIVVNEEGVISIAGPPAWETPTLTPLGRHPSGGSHERSGNLRRRARMAQTQTHPRTPLHGRPGKPYPPVARRHPRRSTDLRTVRTHPPFFDGHQLTSSPRAPDSNKQLAENIRRVFTERGHDFFEKRDAANGRIDVANSNGLEDMDEETDGEAASSSTQPMTPEQLLKMRSDILPRLE